jgi:methyltransferase-like protein/2-polyprenyl-3-methyl-5-hydroxy-6-metoxy-1,4-benzoquinol methylase
MVDGKFCYPLSSPSRLNAIASVFGVKAADPKAANILEIGCGNGGNLIPLTVRYPKSKFVGIDLSDEKIRSAKEYAEELNVKNIEFINKSISEIDFGADKFDFIIAPRIYSWASEPEQDRIFELLRDFLAPNGVAFVAYNTLPGWSNVQTLRDMMRFHGRNFDDQHEKTLEARRMLEFVSENFSDSDAPYKKVLEAEIEFLDSIPYDFVIEDYLGSVNNPCYFYKFIESAAQKGLTYLADCDLPSMYIGNQTQRAVETLSGIEDIVRQEQYVDFLNNRRFRSTLLVKDTVTINRHLNLDTLEGLWFVPAYGLIKPIEENTQHEIEELELADLHAPGRTAKISGQILSVCFIELIKSSPVPQSVEDLTSAAFSVLKGVTKDEVSQTLKASLLDFIFKGLVLITSDHQGFGSCLSDKPEIFKVARQDASFRNTVPNLRHEMVQLSDDQRILAQYCTGENLKDFIVEQIKTHVAKGELSVEFDGSPISSDSDELEKHLILYLDVQLEAFERAALLVASV